MITFIKCCPFGKVTNMKKKKSNLENVLYGIGSKTRKMLANVQNKAINVVKYVNSEKFFPVVPATLAFTLLGTSLAPGIAMASEGNSSLSMNNSSAPKEIFVESNNYAKTNFSKQNSLSNNGENQKITSWKEIVNNYVNKNPRSFVDEQGNLVMVKNPINYAGVQKSSELKTTELPTDLNNPFYNLNPRVVWNHPEGPMKMKRYGDGVDPNGGDYITTQADLDKMISDGVSTTVTNYNYWQDMNGDGTFGDWKDQEIMGKKIRWEITAPNIWELNPSKAKEYIEKIVNLEKLHTTYGRGWECTDFSLEAELISRGIYDKANSRFAQDNGTEKQYDISRDWTHGIPIDLLSVKLINGGAHSITDVFTGGKNGDVMEFSDYTKIDFSIGKTYDGDEVFERIDPNEYATRYVDTYFNPSFFGVTHVTVKMHEYDFNNGVATSTYSGGNIEQYISKTWDPFDNNGVPGMKLTFSPSKTFEYAPNILVEAFQDIENSEVTGILYPNNTKITTVITNDQDPDPNKLGHYNFPITSKHSAEAGEFNMDKEVIHNVAYTGAPTYDQGSETWSDIAPFTITTRKDTTNRSCDGLVGRVKEYEEATNIVGNSTEELIRETDFNNVVLPTYVSSPADVEYTGNPNDENPLPDLTGAPVFSHPAGEVILHYTDETVREAYGEKDIERTLWGETSTSACERSKDTIQMIYVRSAVGIEEPTSSLEGIVILNNPARGNLRIAYMDDVRINLDSDIYNLNGQMIRDTEPSYMNKGEARNISLSGLSPGLYLLKLKDMDSGKTGVKKIVVAN